MICIQTPTRLNWTKSHSIIGWGTHESRLTYWSSLISLFSGCFGRQAMNSALPSCYCQGKTLLVLDSNNNNNNNHVTLSVRISQTLSRHPSLWSIAFGKSSGQHPVSSQICCSSWTSCLCSSMWRGSREYITYELVPTTPAVSRMSVSTNFDSFRRWPYSCCFVGCCLQDVFNIACSIFFFFVIAFKLFLHPFS